MMWNEVRQDEYVLQSPVGDEPTSQSPSSDHGRDEWPRAERVETLTMIRRAFMKLAVAAVIVSALDWTRPRSIVYTTTCCWPVDAAKIFAGPSISHKYGFEWIES